MTSRFTIGAVVAICSSTAAAQPFDFKGDPLGESLEGWRARHSQVVPDDPKQQRFPPTCSDSSSSISPPREGVGTVVCELHENVPSTIAGVEALIFFTFNTNSDGHENGNGLRDIKIGFESSRHATVVDALVDVYGEPDRTTTEIVQNALGAQFENRITTWMRDGTRIDVMRYAGSLDRSLVTFVHSAMYDEYTRRLNQATAPGSDDL